MKKILVSFILLSATFAVAAPFEAQYGTYKVQSCVQVGSEKFINFCTNAKTLTLSAGGKATNLLVTQAVGNKASAFVGIQLQDDSTNPNAKVVTENGVLTLVDRTIFADSFLIKRVTIKQLDTNSIQLEYSQTSNGWPDPRQNKPYSVILVLKKN